MSDVLKTVPINHVDDLTNARTERLTLSGGSGNVPRWVGLTALALVTQLVGGMASPANVAAAPSSPAAFL